MPREHACPTGPGRRVVTATLLAASLPALAGCGVRLEEDAPDLPLVPRRSPMPGEEHLLGLLGATLLLGRDCAALGSATGATLAALHTAQAHVLRDAVRRGGVPAETIARAEDSSGVSSAAPSATPESVARDELAALADTRGLEAAGTGLAVSLLSLLAQRRAAAALLLPSAEQPGAVDPFDPANPHGAAAAPTSLGAALTQARRARRLLDVVVARSPRDADGGAQRTKAEDTARWLDTVVGRWSRGLEGNLPPVPVDVVLPFPVTDAPSAARLAAQALTELRTAYGRHLAELDPRTLTLAWRYVPDELADLELHAHGWGAELQAFPGLA